MNQAAPGEKIPAIILAYKQAALRIAGLTVLDRLVVAVHRAGAGPITIVTEEPLPKLKRSTALSIPFQVSEIFPGVAGRVLFVEANVLVQAADVRRCLNEGARLVGKKRDGISDFLQVGVLDVGKAGARLLDSFRGVRANDCAPETALSAKQPNVEAIGVAQVVDDRRAARRAECELWTSMKSSADGFVDRIFNRPLGRFLSKVLIHTPVSPNMVSIASILIGVIAAVFLAEGSFNSTLIGAILFQLSAIVDCVDGEIARILFKESPLGKWIDLVGDQIVHISVFAGIAFGLLRNGGDKETIFLGVSAVVGALISFAVVLRGMRQANSGNGLLQKLIDAATNRDFSVIVLALALVQKLHWFLWLAGIGSHLFWMTALSLQLTQKPPGAEPAR
jgi:phosphatidylglycerophosphate synthase